MEDLTSCRGGILFSTGGIRWIVGEDDPKPRYFLICGLTKNEGWMGYRMVRCLISPIFLKENTV